MIVDASTPQSQPLPTPGVRSSQDIVDHLDRVLAAQPPEVQAAVDHAHGIMGLQPPSQGATPYNPKTGENYGGNPAMHDLLDRPQLRPSAEAPIQLMAASGPSANQPSPIPTPRTTMETVGAGSMSGATPLLPGLRWIGNTDLNNRPVLRNPDGSQSTESTTSVGTDKGETLIPTVIGGKRLSVPGAIGAYNSTGKHLGIFDTPANADKYAEGLERAREQEFAENRPSALPTPNPSDGASSSPAVPAPLNPVAAHAALIQNPHLAEMERLHNTGTGASQIHNPFLRGLATVGDVIGSGLFPQFSQFIPGTSAHHQQLIGQEESQIGREREQAKGESDVAHTNAEIPLLGAQTAETNARTANLPAESELKHAEAANYTSEAEARKNPDLQVVAHPVIDPSDPSKTPRTGYFNKKTGAMTYGPEVAAAPAAESSKPTVEKMDNGDIVAVHYDPATKKSTTQVVYHGDPKIETELAKLEVDGKPHSVVVNKKTGATIKDLGETGEKPPTVNINQGTWSIQEDADGKPIEYNPKTGETRPVAAGGVQKAGTKEKKDAAAEKIAAPARDALQYAEDYSKKPPTGPGDEALMEKFFELAKPSSGFRMTQAQIDMLKHAQGWMNGATAYVHHAATGTWFSDDLRKQIVGTMQDLAKAKVAHLTGGQQHGAEQLHGSGETPAPKTQAEYDAIKPGTVYIDTDGQQKKKK